MKKVMVEVSLVAPGVKIIGAFPMAKIPALVAFFLSCIELASDYEI